MSGPRVLTAYVQNIQAFILIEKFDAMNLVDTSYLD